MKKGINFGENLSLSFKMVFGHIPTFFSIVLIYFIATLGLHFLTNLTVKNTFMIYFDFTGLEIYQIVIGIIAILLSIFFGMVYTLSMLKAANLIAHKKSASPVEIIVTGMKLFWSALKISIRVFFYTFGWPLLIMLIALIGFALISTFMGADSFFNAAADASSLINQDNSDIITISDNNTSLESTMSGMIGMGLSGLGIAAVILFIYFGIARGTNAAFSIYALVNDDIKGKKALEKSIETVKGHFGKVFWNLIGASFIVGVLFAIPTTIVDVITYGEYQDHLLMIAAITLLSSIGSTLTTVFMNNLYLSLKK